MNTYKIYLSYAIAALLMLPSITGCRRAVEVPAPSNSLIGETVFANSKTATAVLTGVYHGMHATNGIADGNWSISKFMATAADESKNYFIGVAATQFYANQLSSNPGTYFWSQLFKAIYAANSVIEGVSKSETLSQEVKDQLTGEAKFIRAFMNFYGVNLYGRMPIVTSTNYRVNNVITRSTQPDVYKLIVQDLLDAKQLLKNEYRDASNNATTERIRPNRAAAAALLARTYLYMKDWTNAEIQATEVIGTAGYTLLNDINKVFLKNSEEAIWQLASTHATITNTLDGFYFTLKTSPGFQHHTTLSTYIVNAFEDKAKDNRYKIWVGSYTAGATTYYYPAKYKASNTNTPVTEYSMIMRVGELYLIRAEARANLNKPTAKNDLDAIRNRAGLGGYTGPLTPAALLAAVMQERRVELFTEWGHRWFDLKRTGALDPLMKGDNGVTAGKGGKWTANDTLVPLPITEISINPKLGQNDGY